MQRSVLPVISDEDRALHGAWRVASQEPAPPLRMAPAVVDLRDGRRPSASPAGTTAARGARHIMRTYRRCAVLLDATSAAAASLLAVLLRFRGLDARTYLLLTAALPLVWAVVLAGRRGYERRFLGTGTEEYHRVADAALVLFTVLAVASFIGHASLSRGYVLVVVPATLALTFVDRHVLRTWLYRHRREGRALQRTLVVGRVDAALGVVEKLDREPEHGLAVVGVCVPSFTLLPHRVGDVPVVGTADDVVPCVDALDVQTVAIASHPDLSGHALRRLSWALEERGVDLVVSPGIVEVAGPRLSIRPVAGLSLLHLERPAMHGARRLLKDVADRLLAVLLLTLASPALVAAAFAVKVSSPGPVLFRQTRIGTDGRSFTMYKFRSMYVDAEQRRAEVLGLDEGNGILFKIRDDPRVTRVGALLRRYSVDELPQLFNVVLGDMSLVGPRPPLPDEVARYDDDATRRLRVRPGITGLWQVSGRSDLSWEESLLLDLRYVDNWSLTMDAQILWRTGRAVLRGAGAY